MRVIRIKMGMDAGLLGGVQSEVSTEVIVNEEATESDIEELGEEAGDTIHAVLVGMGRAMKKHFA